MIVPSITPQKARETTRNVKVKNTNCSSYSSSFKCYKAGSVASLSFIG